MSEGDPEAMAEDPPVPAGGNGFRTLGEMQNKALELMERWDATTADGKTAASAPSPQEVAGFIDDVRATGAVLSSRQDRDLAQATLVFWRSELGNAGGDAPRGLDAIALAPFDPSALPQLAKQSPFPGLSAYTEDTVASFHGREDATKALADRVLEQPVLIVEGASGSGKSSLVQAGLIPELRRRGILGDDGTMAHVLLRAPGSSPIGELLKKVVPAGPDRDGEIRAATYEIAAHPQALAAMLRTHLGKPAILVIDQFEECFTQSSRTEDRKTLAKALTAGGDNMRVVIVIRSDFMTHLAELPGFETIVNDPASRFKALPIPPQNLKAAIQSTADKAELRFADGVVDRLVQAVANEPAGLPLLQFTLERMWSVARADGTNWISNDVESRVGSPREALKRAAEETYDALGIDETKRVARDVFLELVTPGLEREFVRRPRLRRELTEGHNPDIVNHILESFKDARLLRRERGATKEEDRFDVAHEALIRNWPRYVEWLDAFKNANLEFVSFRDTAEQWDRAGRKDAYLANSEALEAAKRFRGRNSVLDAFITDSDEREKKRRLGREQVEREKIARDAEAKAQATGRKREKVYAAMLIGGLLAFCSYIYSRELEARGNLEKLNAATVGLSVKTEELVRATIELAQQKEASRKTQDVLDGRLDQLQQSVGEAVRQLRKGDVSRLRQLLKDISEDDDESLNRLSLSAGPDRTAAVPSPPAVTATAAPPPTPPPASAPTGKTCDAAVWLGSADDPKFRTPQRAPSLLRKGDRIVIDSDRGIRLRQTLPTPDYKMPPEQGILRDGAVAELLDAPRSYSRPSGIAQYWALVRAPAEACVTAYVQYAGADAKLDAVTTALKRVGVAIPTPERIGSAQGLAEVRFFFDEDGDVARRLADEIGRQRGMPMAAKRVLNRSDAMTARVVEIWIDLDKS